MMMIISENTFQRRLFFIYLILLIAEGGIRKWVFPEYANPLLLIRDPLAIISILEALRSGSRLFNLPLLILFTVVILAFLFTFISGHGNFFVALYGLRIYLIHFPLIFIFGASLNYDIVLNIGKWILILSLPMTLLITIQFFSPQSAWVNKGIGDDFQGGFSGAMGYLRPPGTFSFISGVSAFYSLCACYIFYFWRDNRVGFKWLLLASTFCLIISIPISISRTLFFQVLVGFLFSLFFHRNFKLNKSLVLFLVPLIFILLFSPIEKAISAFITRYSRASDVEGDISDVFINRYLGSLIKAVTGAADQPIFGYGLGYGTNVGSVFLTNSRKFLLAEGEWGRTIGEMGPFFGLSIILTRIYIFFRLFVSALKINNLGFPLALSFMSYGVFLIPQGPTSQPTALGFLVVLGALILGSLKITIDE